MKELLRPVRIGGMPLKNRVVMPAMGTGYGGERGEVTERLLAYLKRRAEGGTGLVITEVCAVHPHGRGFPRELGIYDDSFLRGLEYLARTVKEAGAAVAAQLHHAGRETLPQVIGAEPVAPSPIPSRALMAKPRELTREEILDLVECFARAAVRARKAGFDAVELHGAHGYLINQFLSPYSNRREDEYGMPPLGRLRFAREVVRAVKREAGKDFPVIFRLSSSEMVRGGYELEYLLPFLPLLEEDGVDAFHVSCGVYDSPGNPTCPGWHHPPGINLERAEKIRRMVGVPVIVAGKLHDLELAESAVASGQADLVALGRQHLADPRFLEKAAAGHERDICACLCCNQGCIERLTFGFEPITCTVNPECGEEWRSVRVRMGEGRRYLVVGAGPAGMQAALTLAESGAEVELAEREAEVGGQLLSASRPPGKEALAGWVRWAADRLHSLGVELKTGREVGPETLTDRHWDGAVVATGSRPTLPDVAAEEGVEVVLLEARRLLRENLEAGPRVLVVGAGAVGLETAEYLLEKGCEVIVVEENAYSPVSPVTSHGYHLHRLLREKGRLLLSTKVIALVPGGAVALRNGREEELQCDTVVWAAGARSDDWLFRVAEEAGLRARLAGDAAEPRTMLEATREAYLAALELLG